jgi:electron transport complex protein RnfD
MNPALGARCFLMLSFAGHMTNFEVSGYAAGHIVDTVSGATPLADIKAVRQEICEHVPSETSREPSARLLRSDSDRRNFPDSDEGHLLENPSDLSGNLLPYFALIFGGHGFDLYYLATELCGGGIMLGAFFMATDYVTRPITVKGQYIYAVILWAS